MEKDRCYEINVLTKLNLAVQIDVDRALHDAYVELMQDGLRLDELEREILFNLGLIMEKHEDLSKR
jgi:hypothetical protein